MESSCTPPTPAAPWPALAPASVLAVAVLPLLVATLHAFAPAVARWALLVVFAPVVEELVFRAGLQESLLRRLACWHRGAFAANLITALAFATAHVALHPIRLAALTLLPALLVGRVYEQRRRLAPCVALHAGFNAIWLLWAARLFT